MATKDFKIRHSLTVAQNATIEGNLTLGGKTVSRLLDSDEVTTIINSSVTGLADSDLKAIADLRNDLDSESIEIRALRKDLDSDAATVGTFLNDSDNNAIIYATLSGPVTFLAKNDAGETLFPGTAVYIKGVSGNKPTVDKANASSSATMPAFGIISEVSNSGADAVVTTFGNLIGVDTTDYTLGQTIFVSADSDGGLTTTKPTGASELIQNIGIVTRVHQTDGSIRVGGAGRTNDIDNATRARLDTIETRLDSDELQLQTINTRIDNLSTGFDSDQVVAIISENPGSQAIATTVYTFTSAANDSEFTGTDDNGLTLAYTPGKVYVYLNGILLVDTTDYIATNGTSIVLTVAPDSENVLQVVKHVGTVQIGFDSDQVVAIINENVVSGSVDSDVAAIAQLRRDADSDSLRIQAIATEIEQLNVLVDSDLKAIADLRNDVDSDSLKLQALETTVANLSTGIEVFTIYDSDRLAGIGSPSMGDIAYIPGRSSSGGGVAITSATLSGGVLYAGGTYNYSGGVKGSLAVGSVMIVQNSGAVKGYVVTSLQGSSQEILVAALTTTQIADVWANDMLADFPTMPGQGSVGGTSDPVQTVPKFYEGWSSVSNVPGSNPASTTGVVVSGVVGGVSYTSPKAWLYDSDGWDIELVVEGDTNRPEKKVARIEDLFDSDQIVSIINENVVSGSVDSDVAAIAQLRRDADSDSIQIQAIRGAIDSDYALFNAKIALFNGLTDSDLSVVAQLRADVDSDSVKLQALEETVAGLGNTALSINRYDYTAIQSQTVFSGADDNGSTLSYIANKIQVYLNGILLLDGTDYTATNGTSLTLTVAADSDDKLSIIKYLGADAAASDNLSVTRYTYKVAPAGSHTVFDSEFTGADENGNTLSYVVGKIQVYSNGILLEDSDDYIANDGSSVILRAAPDSDDTVTIFKYLGTTQSGFDSEQVVAIINENTGSAGFDSDQVTSIVRETFTNLGNRNIQLGGAEKDSDILGYHIKILGNESNVDSEQNTFNLRNYVERKVCTVNAGATIAYIYYGGFTNANEAAQYDRTSIFINWSGHHNSGAGTIYGRALHATIQNTTWSSGQAFAGSSEGNIPDTTITHDSTNKRFILSIGTSTNGWGTADVTIQVGRFAKQIEWLV